MAHLAKYPRGSIMGLFRHYERHKRPDGDYMEFQNQKINTSKSHLNYNLGPNGNQYARLEKRLSEVRVLNRKNINLMASWVITLPERLKDSPKEQELFFKESYAFLEKKYGKENIISAYVHVDETTPHLHFAFIPVVKDQKRGDLKVSAKELITRTHLQRFHDELNKHMEMAFGYDVGILNNATAAGNKTVEELKSQSMNDDIKTLEGLKSALEKEISLLRGEILDIEEKTHSEAKKALLRKNKVVVSKDVYKALLADCSILQNQNENQRYENLTMEKKIQELSEKIGSRDKDIENQTFVVNNYKNELEKVIHFMKLKGLGKELVGHVTATEKLIQELEDNFKTSKAGEIKWFRKFKEAEQESSEFQNAILNLKKELSLLKAENMVLEDKIKDLNDLIPNNNGLPSELDFIRSFVESEGLTKDYFRYRNYQIEILEDELEF